jgi:hypothetical protein
MGRVTPPLNNKEATMAAAKKVKIKLPLTRTEKDDKWCAVNGKTYYIKRGVEVEVPDYVAEVLQNEEEMLSEGMAYEEEAKKNVDQQ